MSATWDSTAQTVTITFDEPLEEAELSVSVWTVFTLSGPQAPLSAVASGDTVVLHLVLVGIPVSVQYSPPPFEVVGANGATVEGFSMLV